MRQVLDHYDERVLIGEFYLPVARLVRYYGGDLDETHLPFNFQLVTIPGWEASVIREMVDDYEAALPAGAWPNWVLGNHDKPRIASRVGREQARLAHMLLNCIFAQMRVFFLKSDRSERRQERADANHLKGFEKQSQQ